MVTTRSFFDRRVHPADRSFPSDTHHLLAQVKHNKAVNASLLHHFSLPYFWDVRTAAPHSGDQHLQRAQQDLLILYFACLDDCGLVLACQVCAFLFFCGPANLRVGHPLVLYALLTRLGTRSPASKKAAISKNRTQSVANLEMGFVHSKFAVFSIDYSKVDYLRERKALVNSLWLRTLVWIAATIHLIDGMCLHFFHHTRDEFCGPSTAVANEQETQVSLPNALSLSYCTLHLHHPNIHYYPGFCAIQRAVIFVRPLRRPSIFNLDTEGSAKR